MQILLAGLNIDAGTVDEARSLLEAAALELPSGAVAASISDFLKRTVWTPETISAAYARISRDPSPAPELRERARREVEAARRSNRTIIFELGHGSVAEHAVFNFDVLGVSRLALEEIEHHRLCSFTEKSQRYIALDDDAVLPQEIKEAGLAETFSAAMREQFDDYEALYARLLALSLEKHKNLADGRAPRILLEGLAKEDARYVLCLAVPGQLGLTANARNVERMLGRLAAHPLAELREFSRRLSEAVAGLAPSLIKYTQGARRPRHTYDDLQRESGRLAAGFSDPTGPDEDAVKLVRCPPDGDDRIAAALLFAESGHPLETCTKAVAAMPAERREELVRASLHRLECWDPVARAFEEVSLTYELTVSASCFAQLKRHRMATLLAQDYDTALGVTKPPAVEEAGEGAGERFQRAVERAERLHEILCEKVPAAAPYALTNAHRRRVLFSCNVRELYHFARLRLDEHAQWDIRAVAARMVGLARERLPLALTMACGKHEFEKLFEEVFGKPPGEA